MLYRRVLLNRCSKHLLALVAISSVFFGGCNSGIPVIEPAAEMIWPFAEKEEQTNYRTPGQRIEALEELARDAQAYDLNKKQEISAALVEQIRSESDPVIRRQIVRTLGKYETDSALSVLLSGCKDSDSEVRIVSCQSLAHRRGQSSLAALDRALREDEDIDVRLAAAKALGSFQDQLAVTALGAALEDPDPALQFVAVQSLKQSTGRNFGNDVNSWRQYVKGGSPAEVAPPSLTERLLDSSPF